VVTGQVTAELEAKLTLRIRSETRTEITLSTIVDTGFSGFLTLPSAIIIGLQMQRQGFTHIRLGNGQHIGVNLYEGQVWWNDGWRPITIQESEGDPLLGMELLRNHDLFVKVIVGGEVTVEDMV
jgi:predicted aspartyl protease